MNTATYVIIAVIAVIVFFAIRSTAKHMKGQGGCCGGGEEISAAEDTKVLENPMIGQKVVHIEGMHCENCKNSVERSVNRLDGAACRVDLKHNLAEVSYDRPLDENALRFAIERLDFQVTGI
jgi:copper chaperone CopZ